MTIGWTPQPARDVADGLILFDGVCVFCSWSVQFVLRRDRDERFRFVPIQSPYGRTLAQRFTIDIEYPETNAVILNGIAYFKSDATLAVLSVLPYWRWLGVIQWLPRMIRNWIYDRVAKNRYQLFGKTEQCLLPSAEIARRFLHDEPPVH